MYKVRDGWFGSRPMVSAPCAQSRRIAFAAGLATARQRARYRRLGLALALLLMAAMAVGCADPILAHPPGNIIPKPTPTPGPTPTPTPLPTPTPTPTPTPSAPSAIAFTSMRALDGSDFSPAGQPMNVWTVNVDGSGLTAVTKLANLTSPAAILINHAPVWSPDGKLIAFASDRALDGSDNSASNGNFNIWVMNADGTNAKPLTNLTAINTASILPVWSPDGAKIAYTSQRSLDGTDALGFGTNIWVINADGTGNKHLTDEDLGASSGRAVWSPDGTLVAFASNRALDGTHNASANNTSNVWVMNSNDGSGRIALSTYTAAGIGPQGYAWSPDNVHLVYALNGDLTLDKASVENLWSVNPHIASPFARTALTQLTHPHHLDPAFSPDGSKIIFMSNRALAGGDALEGSGVVNFWVMNADGSAPAPLTQYHVFGLNTQAFQGGEYQLSKDGSQIVFASPRALDGSEALDPGAQNIWVMNADGSGQKPVTKTISGNTDAFFPQWHP